MGKASKKRRSDTRKCLALIAPPVLLGVGLAYLFSEVPE